jgi:hypothetical protein
MPLVPAEGTPAVAGYVPAPLAAGAGGVLKYPLVPVQRTTSWFSQNAPDVAYGAAYKSDIGFVASQIDIQASGTSGAGAFPTIQYAFYQAPGGAEGVCDLICYGEIVFDSTSAKRYTSTLKNFAGSTITAEFLPGYFYVLWTQLSAAGRRSALYVFGKQNSATFDDSLGLLPNGAFLASFETAIGPATPPAATFTPGKSATIIGSGVQTIAQIILLS